MENVARVTCQDDMEIGTKSYQISLFKLIYLLIVDIHDHVFSIHMSGKKQCNCSVDIVFSFPLSFLFLLYILCFYFTLLLLITFSAFDFHRLLFFDFMISASTTPQHLQPCPITFIGFGSYFYFRVPNFIYIMFLCFSFPKQTYYV